MTFFEPAADGVRVRVRVAPKASRTAVAGLAQMPDGKYAIKVSVTEAPEGGRANAAVVKLLAKEWGVPRSAFTVTSGETNRNKVLHVTGSTGLCARIESWSAGRA